MDDPVQAEDGLTYERAAIENNRRYKKGNTLIPNENLKRSIAAYVGLSGNLMKKRDEDSTIDFTSGDADWRHKPNTDRWARRQELRLEEGENKTERLDAITCPITMKIMADPVLASDGHTYERSAMKMWLTRNNKSPKTNLRLTNKKLASNLYVKKAIHHYLELWPEEASLQFKPDVSAEDRGNSGGGSPTPSDLSDKDNKIKIIIDQDTEVLPPSPKLDDPPTPSLPHGWEDPKKDHRDHWDKPHMGFPPCSNCGNIHEGSCPGDKKGLNHGAAKV